MRKLLSTFFLTLFFASTVVAAVPTDAEVKRLLVGTWTRNLPAGKGDGEMTFKEDGTFSSYGNFDMPRGPMTLRGDGNWRVEHGVLIEEITHCSHPLLFRPGYTTRDTLTSVTQQEYLFQTERGQDGGYTRASPGQKSKTSKPGGQIGFTVAKSLLLLGVLVALGVGAYLVSKSRSPGRVA